MHSKLFELALTLEVKSTVDLVLGDLIFGLRNLVFPVWIIQCTNLVLCSIHKLLRKLPVYARDNLSDAKAIIILNESGSIVDDSLHS